MIIEEKARMCVRDNGRAQRQRRERGDQVAVGNEDGEGRLEEDKCVQGSKNIKEKTEWERGHCRSE